MKNFWEGLVEWKTNASLMFTGSIILCAAISLFVKETAVSITVIASLLVLSAAGTFLQFLAFTDHIIKKMRYTLRMAVFAVSFFALIAANARIFRWFPFDKSRWLIFTAIFLVVFTGMTIGFEIYYRATGKKYDGLLGQYRRQREENNQTSDE